MDGRIEVRSGADGRQDHAWTDEETGDAKPLQSATIVEASPEIMDRLSIINTDLPNGEYQVRLEGTDLIRRGAYWFNVQVMLQSGDTDATGRIIVHVS